MEQSFDLMVIGGGSAGLTAATTARKLGARVVLIERDRLGGDCTWTGCIPSKTFIHAARLAQRARSSEVFGITCDNLHIDFGQTMRHVRDTIERVYAFETPAVLEQAGIVVMHGSARFSDPHTLDVDGRRISARTCIICTGASPSVPPISGIEDVPHLTSSTVFDLTDRPARLIVLGGGATGVELAQAFRRLGSEVTLFESGDRILAFAEAEASTAVADVLRDEGIELRLAETVDAVSICEDGVRVIARGGAVNGDRLLIATGRRPRIDGLALDRAGVDVTRDGITTDVNLQTTQPHIYAAGDVTGGPQFTHVAGWQGAIAARNALLPGASRGVRTLVPWVVFSDPEIAHAGRSETEARRTSDDVRVIHLPSAQIDRAQSERERAGFVKLIVQGGERLVGATIVGSGASETIGELALAIEQRVPLSAIARTLHPYPTWGLAIQEASGTATLDRLTSGLKGKLLRLLAHRV